MEEHTSGLCKELLDSGIYYERQVILLLDTVLSVPFCCIPIEIELYERKLLMAISGANLDE